MVVKLYMVGNSAPGQAVLLTLKTLNIPHEVVKIPPRKNEARWDPYLQMRPEYKIPALVDEHGFKVVGSHAINVYLVEKHGSPDRLYPKDLKKRTTVNEILYFDNGVLFPLLRSLKRDLGNNTVNGMTQEYARRFEDAYATLDKYASQGAFIAAQHLTIADFPILTTVTRMKVFYAINEGRFPMLSGYLKRVKQAVPAFSGIKKKGSEKSKQKYRNFNVNIGFVLDMK